MHNRPGTRHRSPRGGSNGELIGSLPRCCRENGRGGWAGATGQSPTLPPMRVVSLLPSATECLLAITGSPANPRARLVGRSHECDFPASVGLDAVAILTAAKTEFVSSAQVDQAVSAQLATGESLYTLDVEQLAALKPDLIITQDLCKVCSINLTAVRSNIRRTMSPQPRVVSLNPTTIEGGV